MRNRRNTTNACSFRNRRLALTERWKKFYAIATVSHFNLTSYSSTLSTLRHVRSLLEYFMLFALNCGMDDTAVSWKCPLLTKGARFLKSFVKWFDFYFVFWNRQRLYVKNWRKGRTNKRQKLLRVRGKERLWVLSAGQVCNLIQFKHISTQP